MRAAPLRVTRPPAGQGISQYVFHKSASFCEGFGLTGLMHWFLGSTRVYTPMAISIGSAILRNLRSWPTDRQTDRPRHAICRNQFCAQYTGISFLKGLWRASSIIHSCGSHSRFRGEQIFIRAHCAGWNCWRQSMFYHQVLIENIDIITVDF